MQMDLVHFPRRPSSSERCDKDALVGLVVVVACRLLLLSPCHAVLARETRAASRFGGNLVSAAPTQLNTRNITHLSSCSHADIQCIAHCYCRCPQCSREQRNKASEVALGCPAPRQADRKLSRAGWLGWLPKCCDPPPTSLPPSTARHALPAALQR